MRWMSLKAAALRAWTPACARDVREEVIVEKMKGTMVGSSRCWPATRGKREGVRCANKRLWPIVASGPRARKISGLQGTNDYRALSLGDAYRPSRRAVVCDFRAAGFLKTCRSLWHPTADLRLEEANVGGISARATTCQGGQGIKVNRRRRNELCNANTRTSAQAGRPNPLKPF